jgi:hypothetical protein
LATSILEDHDVTVWPEAQDTVATPFTFIDSAVCFIIKSAFDARPSKFCGVEAEGFVVALAGVS